MARSAIPDFGTEYPDYVYREWPKQVGLDEIGEQIIAHDQAEYDNLLPTVAFPKVMGKDKNGKDVVAYLPRDLDWKKSQVVQVVKLADVENTLVGEVRRGPGRSRNEAA